MIGLYAGSFDPMTYGHWDIINRAYKLCGRLFVVVANNPDKKTLFTADERVALIEEHAANNGWDQPSLRVLAYKGLIVNLAKELHADAIFRGLRPHGDFEPEYGLATINAELAPKIQTLFMVADPKLAAVSSSAVKQLHAFGQDITRYVPPHVAAAIKQRK